MRKTLLRVDTETGVCLQYFQASKLAPLGAVASGPTLMSLEIVHFLERETEAQEEVIGLRCCHQEVEL